MRGLQRDANNHVVRFFGADDRVARLRRHRRVPRARARRAHRQRPGPLPRGRAGPRLAQGVLLLGATARHPAASSRRPIASSASTCRAWARPRSWPSPSSGPAATVRVGIHNATTAPRPDRQHGRPAHLGGGHGHRGPELRQPPDEPLLHEVVAGVPGQAEPRHDLDACLPAARRALRHPGRGRPRHRPLAAAHPGAHRRDAHARAAAPRATAAGCAWRASPSATCSARRPPPSSRTRRPASKRRARSARRARCPCPASAAPWLAARTMATRRGRAPSWPRPTWPRRSPGCRPR